MPSLFSHSSLHSIKRASCSCPDHQPAINMINMRVGVMWYRASHARRLWQTEHRRRNQLRELFAYMRALRCTLEWDIKARDELRFSCTHTPNKSERAEPSQICSS